MTTRRLLLLISSPIWFPVWVLLLLCAAFAENSEQDAMDRHGG